MLNKYQWGNYLLSGGNKIVTVFQDLLNCENLDKFTSTINTLVNNFCPNEFRGIRLEQEIDELIINPLLNNELSSLFEPNKKYTIKSALNFIRREYKKTLREEKCKSSDNNVLELFLCNIDWLTTQLSLEMPELFIPYYFQRNFNVFSNIVDMFGIKLDLNNIPIKSDYKGRFYYYGEICNILHTFRIENNLSIAELWAFLYDYAPKCVGGLDYIKKDLSEPQSAFFIGGASNDVFSDSPKDKKYPKMTFWQCNPYTRAGDMIVFYMTSPDPQIDSIWRSVTEGFNDPFFWYYRCTYMAYVGKFPDNLFTIKNMKSDDVLSKLPIVRKNMQGVNGTEIPPETYNYIIQKANIDDSFKIKYSLFKTNNKTGTINLRINNEHDVERKILDPLLEKLGWKKQDYETQKRVKMGRNMRLIPDYLIKPDFKKEYHEKCYFIWEVKESISDDKELDEAKGQVISYARRLSAEKCAIISKEGIWIMDKKDDYTKYIFHSSFKDLKNPNVFKKLINIAGKKNYK